jgi:transcriptional regulator with XRE-family HTH domain
MTNQELLRKFGRQMRAFRQKRGLSQEKLAELAGLHRNYTGILERGLSNPTLLAIVALARALKVRPASLLPDLD